MSVVVACEDPRPVRKRWGHHVVAESGVPSHVMYIRGIGIVLSMTQRGQKFEAKSF